MIKFDFTVRKNSFSYDPPLWKRYRMQQKKKKKEKEKKDAIKVGLVKRQ